MTLRWLEPLRQLGPACVVASALAGLAGCTSAPQGGTRTDLGELVAPAEAVLTGRLAIRAARTQGGINPSMSAGFELRGSETEGSLRLLSPLGTTLADAQWTAAGVLLRADGRQHGFGSLDEMAREVFGQEVPLRALWHWLRGQPWPQAQSTPLPDGSGFTQLGWLVDTWELAEAGRLVAQRDGAPGQVQLRIRLDR